MKYLLFLFPLLLSAGTVLAEDGEAVIRKKGIAIRAFAFALHNDISSVELREEEREIIKIELPTGQLRERHRIGAVRKFVAGTTVGDKFRILARIILPPTGRDFILVFVPTESGYRVFPIRTDDPDFRGGDTILFNFTDSQIAVMLGTTKKAVAPFKSSILHPGIPENATYYQALFATVKDGEYVPFNNTRWPVNTNTKAVAFVYKDPATGESAYRSVTELAEN